MSENVFAEWQHLPGLPLTKATRLGHVQYFHFGKAHITNAYGLVLDVGAWTLEVSCFWQVEEAGSIHIAFQDAQVPRNAQALADPAFDPQVPGSNLRDRKLQELVKQPPQALTVQQVTVTPDGDVVLTLPLNRLLRLQPSQGVLPESPSFWRLFSNAGSGQWLALGPEGVTRG